MTAENLIKELERYRNELTQIMGRFARSSDGYNIHSEDDPRFQTFVIEIIDLINDSIGKNQYSPLINQIFMNGISNFYHSRSYKSVEDIVSVLNSVITRLKRNPELCNPKKETITTEKKPIEYPDKITLKWLYSHVPCRFWIYLISIFIAVFTLGATFTTTKIYKSLIDLFTANNNWINVNDTNYRSFLGLPKRVTDTYLYKGGMPSDVPDKVRIDFLNYKYGNKEINPDDIVDIYWQEAKLDQSIPQEDRRAFLATGRDLLSRPVEPTSKRLYGRIGIPLQMPSAKNPTK